MEKSLFWNGFKREKVWLRYETDSLVTYLKKVIDHAWGTYEDIVYTSENKSQIKNCVCSKLQSESR